MPQHSYQTLLQWTGNKGRGTQDYRAYDRAYEIEVKGKQINRSRNKMVGSFRRVGKIQLGTIWFSGNNLCPPNTTIILIRGDRHSQNAIVFYI